MFGISLTEVAMIAVVALVVVGPQKLPGLLRTLGEWVRRIREMTSQVRAQTGIDDILRQEGIDGGLAELRGLVRGDLSGVSRSRHNSALDDDPYEKAADIDQFREYPPEGVDSAGAVPDDLVDDSDEDDRDRAEKENARDVATKEPGSDPGGAVEAEDTRAKLGAAAVDAKAGAQGGPKADDGAEGDPKTGGVEGDPKTGDLEGDASKPSPAPWETDRDP